MLLQRRNRILRATPQSEAWLQKLFLTPNDFVPLFIDEGENVKTEIASMPNYSEKHRSHG